MTDFEAELQTLLREREWDVPSDLDVLTPVRRRSRQLRRRRTAAMSVTVVAGVLAVLAFLPAVLQPRPPQSTPPMRGRETVPTNDVLVRGPATPIHNAIFALVPARLPVSAVRYQLVSAVSPHTLIVGQKPIVISRLKAGLHPAQLVFGPQGARTVYVYRGNYQGIVVSVGGSFHGLADQDLAMMADAIFPLSAAGRLPLAPNEPIRLTATNPMRVIR